MSTPFPLPRVSLPAVEAWAADLPPRERAGVQLLVHALGEAYTALDEETQRSFRRYPGCTCDASAGPGQRCTRRVSRCAGRMQNVWEARIVATLSLVEQQARQAEAELLAVEQRQACFRRGRCGTPEICCLAARCQRGGL